MTYRLGIDLGTTFTAAAVLRDGEAPEAVPLGPRGAAPSVLFLDADGKVVFGEAAEQRGPEAPERIARHFKRRVGDLVPLVLAGGTKNRIECYAHDLAAAVITCVVSVVAAREGSRPVEIAVTHPAAWNRRKVDLLLGALQAQDLPPVTLITEPEAAAVGYAHTGLIEHPATLAVYDLGGGTLDIALLATTPGGGFTRLGDPAGLEGLGGVDFDDAILGHVLAAVDANSWAGVDGDQMDSATLRALAQLRAASVTAKERLSTEPTASISLSVDGRLTNVHVERATFDFLIADMVARSVSFFEDVVTGAGVGLENLSAVLLTGGSAQVPLVTDMLADRLPDGVRIIRALDPKARVAAGAVLSLNPAAPVAALPAPRRGEDLAVAQARAYFAAGTEQAAAPVTRRPVAAARLAPAPIARPAAPRPRPTPPASHKLPAPRGPKHAGTAPPARPVRRRPRVRSAFTLTRIGVVTVLTGSALVGLGFWLNAEAPTVPAPTMVSTPAKAADAPGPQKAKAHKQPKIDPGLVSTASER